MARILVVDDDRVLLKLIQWRLERAGHEVISLTSPQNALELVLGGKMPDAVVLDVSMPEISGVEVLQTLRLGFGMKDRPAVFLSGRISPEEIETGRALGAIYLTKPFVASALLKAIDQVLKGQERP